MSGEGITMKARLWLPVLAVVLWSSGGTPLPVSPEGTHGTPSPENCDLPATESPAVKSKRNATPFQYATAIGMISGGKKREAVHPGDPGEEVLRRQRHRRQEDDISTDFSANAYDYVDGGIQKREVGSTVEHLPFPQMSDSDDVIHRERRDLTAEIGFVIGFESKGGSRTASDDGMSDKNVVSTATTRMTEEESTTKVESTSLPQSSFSTNAAPQTTSTPFRTSTIPLEIKSSDGLEKPVENPNGEDHTQEASSHPEKDRIQLNSGSDSVLASTSDHLVNKEAEKVTSTLPDHSRKVRSPQGGGFDGFVLSDFSGYRGGRSVSGAPELKKLNPASVDQVILEELPRTSRRNRREALDGVLIQEAYPAQQQGDAQPTMTYIIPIVNSPEYQNPPSQPVPEDVVRIHSVNEKASAATSAPAASSPQEGVASAAPTFTSYVSVSSDPSASSSQPVGPVEIVTPQYPQSLPSSFQSPEAPAAAPVASSAQTPTETYPLEVEPNVPAPAPFVVDIPAPQTQPQAAPVPSTAAPCAYEGTQPGVQIAYPPPAGTWVQSQPKTSPVPVVEKTIQVNADGSFVYSFETADGTKVAEAGRLRELPSDPYESDPTGTPRSAGAGARLANTVMGGYSYTAPDGTFVSLRYVADENGFRTVGEALPYSRVGPQVADRFGQE